MNGFRRIMRRSGGGHDLCMRDGGLEQHAIADTEPLDQRVQLGKIMR